MDILLANDDGILADGIRAMARELMGSHRVVIAAPDSERSGASHSITLTSPLRARQVELAGLEGVEAYSINGAPADCVILAINALGIRPDLIISGINHGYNLGTDVHYSGTVSAAMEGALVGIPSMAVSMQAVHSRDFSAAAGLAAELIPQLMEGGSLLYNVNVPDLPGTELKGIRYTPLSSRMYYAPFVRRTDPRNMDYFWWPGRVEYDGDMNADCDERWVLEGYATVTPLMQNMTDRAALDTLNR